MGCLNLPESRTMLFHLSSRTMLFHLSSRTMFFHLSSRTMFFHLSSRTMFFLLSSRTMFFHLSSRTTFFHLSSRTMFFHLPFSSCFPLYYQIGPYFNRIVSPCSFIFTFSSYISWLMSAASLVCFCLRFTLMFELLRTNESR